MRERSFTLSNSDQLLETIAAVDIELSDATIASMHYSFPALRDDLSPIPQIDGQTDDGTR
jgi:hypothetical protein